MSRGVNGSEIADASIELIEDEAGESSINARRRKSSSKNGETGGPATFGQTFRVSDDVGTYMAVDHQPRLQSIRTAQGPSL